MNLAQTSKPLLRLAASLALATALLVGPASAEPDAAAERIARVLVDAEGDPERAIAALERQIEAASADELPVFELYLAEQYRMLGEGRSAQKLYRSVSRSSSPLARGGDLGMIVQDGLDQLDEEGMSLLGSVAEEGLPQSLNAERFLLLAAAAAAHDQAKVAGEYTSLALKYAATNPVLDRDIRARLRALIEGELPAPSRPSTDDIAALDRAVREGDRARVTQLADRILQTAEPDSDRAAIARYAERRIDAPLSTRTIGLLLPRSGRYAPIGLQIKRAVELGVASSGGLFKLITIDSGETPEDAIAAFEKLVLQDGVMAVIGPLRTELADGVARVAHALRVPLVGLHQSPTALVDRDWIFDGLATPAAQAQALVTFVIDDREMESFAIFAPDTPYGQASADAFAGQVKAHGGRIAVREHYDATESDLIAFAKKLGRKDYEARAAEFRRIRREIADAGGDPSRAVLPPEIDFDAIFVPDNHRRIPVAAAALAYEEFPVGQFQIDKDKPTIPLLGLSGWNHPELVSTGGPYVRDSYFVDVWWPEDPQVQAFMERYQQETRRPPNALEAQAYTVGRLVGAAGRELPTRTAMRERLIALTVEPTGTGATRIDPESRRVNHRIRMLTLDRDGIREVPPKAVQSDESPE